MRLCEESNKMTIGFHHTHFIDVIYFTKKAFRKIISFANI